MPNVGKRDDKMITSGRVGDVHERMEDCVYFLSIFIRRNFHNPLKSFANYHKQTLDRPFGVLMFCHPFRFSDELSSFKRKEPGIVQFAFWAASKCTRTIITITRPSQDDATEKMVDGSQPTSKPCEEQNTFAGPI